MHQLLVELLNSALLNKTVIKPLKTFSQVLICDSSWIELSSKLKDIFPGFGGSSSESHCKIQLAYDVVNNQISSIGLTEGVLNDSTYAVHFLNVIKQGALLLADLGYSSARFFHKLNEKGAYFISRLKSDFKIFDVKTLREINLLKLLKQVKRGCFEVEILIGINQKVSTKCRLIGLKAPKDVARKRRLRIKTRHDGRTSTPKDITLQLCDWTLFITNIPDKMLHAEKIHTLYRLRWQIELIFKQFKSTLQIDQINTSNKHRVRCEIYGKLIAAIIVTKIHGKLNAQSWNANQVEISFDKICKRFQERAFMFLSLIQDSFKKAITFLESQLEKTIHNCIKLVQRSRKTSLELLCCAFKQTFMKLSPDSLPLLT